MEWFLVSEEGQSNKLISISENRCAFIEILLKSNRETQTEREAGNKSKYKLHSFNDSR